MEDSNRLHTPAEGATASQPSELKTAIRTVSRHALKSGLGSAPGEQAAFTAAWSATQLRLLLSYLERHAATVETALGSIQEPDLKEAVGVVLKDAADRCAFVSRDLDIVRGDTLGTPVPEWSVRAGQPAVMRHARHSRATAVAGSAKSL